MAAKRKVDAEAQVYWLSNTTQLRQKPTGDQGSTKKLGNGELILGAHKWGEAMVHAYLQNLVDSKVSALERRRQFDGAAEAWYKRGYRYYLLPTSKDAPEAIAEHKSPAGGATESQLIPMIDRHTTHWMKHHSAEIRAKVLAAEEAEKQKARAANALAERAAAQRVVRQKRAHTPLALAVTTNTNTNTNTSTNTKTNTTNTPTTMAASQPLPTRHLNPRLARLLDKPSLKESHDPHACIRELVVAAFANERIARVWNDSESDNVRRLTFLDMRADDLCDALEERGLGDACGRVCKEEDKYKATLKKAGLVLRGKGGFNGVWEARGTDSAKWVAEALPPEVSTQFYCGRVVLRCPTPAAYPLRYDEAIDEATNMLFTALSKCGPRVAALAFSHRKVYERGRLVDEYRIFSFLETATMSVDARYGSTTPRVSAADSRFYHDALLTAIYRISAEGYVHLDATLRNFVDFYPRVLPEKSDQLRVSVIDVEGRHFRRVIHDSSSEWRYLFLFNLMVVQVFLKTRLADQWSPDVHWSRWRNLCHHLIRELPDKHNLAAITSWKDEIPVLGKEAEFFPELGEGEYAGTSPEAVSRAAGWQLRHYLLRQPIQEAQANYTSVLLPDPKNPKKASTDNELRKAREWFDTTYRMKLLPPRFFFEGKLREKKRFVEVAFEFLDTPITDLRKQCANSIPPTSKHERTSSESFILGVV